MQALAFDRTQRFDNAVAMQRALGTVLEVLSPSTFVELDLPRPKQEPVVAKAAPSAATKEDSETKATVRVRPTPAPGPHGPTVPEPRPRSPATDPQPPSGSGRRWGVLAIGAGVLIAALATVFALSRSSESESDAGVATDASVVPVDAQPSASDAQPKTAKAGEVVAIAVRPNALVSVDGYLEQAVRLASGYFPDAELVTVEAHRVNLEGLAAGHLRYRFVSPSARAAKSLHCMIKIEVLREVVKLDTMPVKEVRRCSEPAPKPRCSTARVMQAFATTTHSEETGRVRYSRFGWSVYTKATKTWKMPSDACGQ